VSSFVSPVMSAAATSIGTFGKRSPVVASVEYGRRLLGSYGMQRLAGVYNGDACTSGLSGSKFVSHSCSIPGDRTSTIRNEPSRAMT